MKLNKLQRYTIYCIMLEEVENNLIRYQHAGLCYLFTIVLNYPDEYASCIPIHSEFSFYRGFNMFPELYRKFYRCDNSFYFNCWEERIAALKKCIEETHPDNNLKTKPC